jgi:CubicO group peptidase (beta-lactamase class C family)
MGWTEAPSRTVVRYETGATCVTLPRAIVCGLLALGVLSSTAHVRAQGFVQTLFEQYLESLRRQAGIPGLSAAIMQGGRIVWERGFGYQDVDRSMAARPDTPYPVGGLTETLTSALVLRCVEEGQIDLEDPIRNWEPSFADAGATIRQVLSHTSTGTFRYDQGRFATLTAVVEACTESPYRQAIAERILDFLAMNTSVPGHDLDRADTSVRGMFSGASLDRYSDIMDRLATPYRVDGRGNAAASSLPEAGIDASTGLISTVRDFAQFVSALDDGDLVRRSTVETAFSSQGASVPFGLGWFVQNYRGYKLVWQFGEWRNAYSSLVLKVPERDLTLILLANSDGLTASFPLRSGDVTTSLFARVFLSVYL